MLAKLECYLGERYSKKKTFDYRNRMISIFLFVAGVECLIYMGRMVFSDVPIMKYDMILAIMIACIAFIEFAIAISGCFKSYGVGHYYRNIKLISLCSALTAIVLTEVALTSFASENDLRIINGLVGMMVAVTIMLISIYILIAPRISILDKEYNAYKLKDNKEGLKKETIIIKLTNSKFYGNYVYIGAIGFNVIEGYIKKEKSPIFQWNIYVKILVILLSEILIFSYSFGALASHFKCKNIVSKLDKELEILGYEKIIKE